ncbi:MAG TPA: transposase [Roseiflexaceae bacterium]|nr:transposase [Roseiflexaceae bacterium]
MLKTFVYRLYPSKPQARLLDRTLETCRRWYNQCLAERRDAYQQRGETVGKFAQLAKVKEQKAIHPYAKGIHSHVLHVVVADLDKAFQAFFRRVKAGETPGFPRFKGRNRFSSFGFKEHENGFKVDGRRLKLSGIGRVAVRWHRPLEGQIKTVRITRRAGKWYACFACAVDATPLPATGRAIGVDVGIASLITTSEGAKEPHPGWYRVAQRKLRVLQRRVARRKKGSTSRRKAVLQLQRQHERIANTRKDYLKKLVHRLITHYDRIALEDLRIPAMVRNRHLAKSILDAGWGYLVQHLTRKAAEAGRVVLLVDPRYTSKTCSQCGRIFEALSLSDRWIACGCGLRMDRDHNAAVNILKRAGQVRWGTSGSLDSLPQEAVGL